jgi:hypothetical protein
MHYNFCRIHKSLQVALAMEAGEGGSHLELGRSDCVLGTVRSIPYGVEKLPDSKVRSIFCFLAFALGLIAFGLLKYSSHPILQILIGFCFINFGGFLHRSKRWDSNCTTTGFHVVLQ